MQSEEFGTERNMYRHLWGGKLLVSHALPGLPAQSDPGGRPAETTGQANPAGQIERL